VVKTNCGGIRENFCPFNEGKKGGDGERYQSEGAVKKPEVS
jgi:hypothetical protein